MCRVAGAVGCGTVYKLTPPFKGGAKWTEKILRRFAVGFPDDGVGPNGGLVLDTKGDLYGTTAGGGSSQNGVAFQLVRSAGQWSENVLRTFT